MRFLALTAFVCALVSCPNVFAESPSAPVAAESVSVRVIAAGDRATIAALQNHILNLLAQRQVHLEWTLRKSVSPEQVLDHESQQQVLANIWLDLTSAKRALLYLEHPETDRFLLRALPLEGGYDEIARETLANIVESAVDVLLEGGELGVSRAQAVAEVEQQNSTTKPATRSVDEAPLATPRSVRHRVKPSAALFVGVRGEALRGISAFGFGPRLGSVITTRKASSWAGFAWFEAGYRAPFNFENHLADLRLEGVGGRVFGGARFRSGVLGLRVGAGGGVDGDHVTPRAEGARLKSSPPFWVVTPFLSVMTSLEIGMPRGLFAFVSATADLDLAGHHFQVAQEAGTETVLSPWRLRPAGQVGLGYSFAETRK